MKIGLDLGNSHTIVTNGENTVEFPSMVTAGYDGYANIDGCHVVEYGGCKYVIGTGTAMLQHKHGTLYYKLLLLTAIGLIMDKEKLSQTDIDIVVSLPIEEFKNHQKRKEVEDIVKSFGMQTININGENKFINIKQCKVFAESAINILDEKKFCQQKVVIVDIGGLTIDTLGIDYNKPNKSKTFNYGINIIRKQIATLFQTGNNYRNAKICGNAEFELFECILKDKLFILGDSAIDVREYRNALQGYISQIMSELEGFYELGDKKIIFIGGGAIALNDFIRVGARGYNFEIAKNAPYLNCMANYAYCETI